MLLAAFYVFAITAIILHYTGHLKRWNCEWILIVLAIVGLIAGGIAVFAIPKFKDAQIQTTKQSAQQLHTIAEGWHATHTQECPTAELLKKEKEIATTSNINDAWGKPFKIECLDDGDIVVTSFGPDGKENTADDIRVPEAAKN